MEYRRNIWVGATPGLHPPMQAIDNGLAEFLNIIMVWNAKFRYMKIMRPTCISKMVIPLNNCTCLQIN